MNAGANTPGGIEKRSPRRFRFTLKRKAPARMEIASVSVAKLLINSPFADSGEVAFRSKDVLTEELVMHLLHCCCRSSSDEDNDNSLFLRVSGCNSRGK
jgi:hypothetical protein